MVAEFLEHGVEAARRPGGGQLASFAGDRNGGHPSLGKASAPLRFILILFRRNRSLRRLCGFAAKRLARVSPSFIPFIPFIVPCRGAVAVLSRFEEWECRAHICVRLIKRVIPDSYDINACRARCRDHVAVRECIKKARHPIFRPFEAVGKVANRDCKLAPLERNQETFVAHRRRLPGGAQDQQRERHRLGVRPEHRVVQQATEQEHETALKFWLRGHYATSSRWSLGSPTAGAAAGMSSGRICHAHRPFLVKPTWRKPALR